MSDQESKKSLRAPLAFLLLVLAAIVVAVLVKKCPIPVPAGDPAPEAPAAVTAPIVKEEPKKVEEPKVVQPVDAGSTGMDLTKADAGLRVGHL